MATDALFLIVRAYSVMSDSETPWTIAHQTPLSMGFSRQEYWSGLSFPPRHVGPSWVRDQTCVSYTAGGFLTTEPPGKPNFSFSMYLGRFIHLVSSLAETVNYFHPCDGQQPQGYYHCVKRNCKVMNHIYLL